MTISNLVRQIGRSSGVTGGHSDDDTMNIIEFIESPYGLKFAKEYGGQALFPVQKFILKMFYNLPLEAKEKVVFVPKTWRHAQASIDAGMYAFTEVEYLEYLYNNGRCNIREQDHDRKTLILPIGRRAGKCVSISSTYLYTDKGMLTLSEMAPKGILKDDEWYPTQTEIALEGKANRASADSYYNRGKAPTFKIKSHCGYHIECTAEHRVKVMTPEGTVQWKYGGDIEIGDKLAIHRNVGLWPEKYVDVSGHHPSTEEYSEIDPVVLPLEIDEKWGLLLGILTGDGSWSDNRRVCVTNGCSEFLLRVKALYNELFGNYVKYQCGKEGDAEVLMTRSRRLRNFLHNLGWVYHPDVDKKSVPWVIRRSPKSVVAAFLRGLFETDGGISKEGRVVGFSTASRKMAEEVQLLLLNFGIVCRVKEKYVEDYERPYYELTIFGTKSRQIFAEEIGFITDRKNKPLQEVVVDRDGGSPKSRLESIPYQKKWVRQLIGSIPKRNPLCHGPSENGWGRMHVRKAAGNVCKPSSADEMTYPRLRSVLDAAREQGGCPDLIRHGENLLELDYFYDEVVAVEDGYTHVADIQVPGHSMYVANGMTNHNSTISAMIAAYETYKLLKKHNPQNYYGTPEGSSIQICSIATAKDQAAILYKEVRRHYNNCDFFRPYMHSETQTQALFHTPHDMDTGTKPSIRITFYSSVAKGIRGSANIVAIMDEVAFFNPSGQASAHEVYQALSPSLAQFSPKDPNDASKPLADSEGRMILISSPDAKQGLFYEQYEMALSGGAGSKDLLMIQAPTWEVNPTIPRSYFEKEYEKDPIIFTTEFGAEFTDKVRSWIERDEDLMQCVNPEHKPFLRGRPRDRHFLGFDLAPKGDRTALVLTRLHEGKIQLAYHELWQAKTDWYDINPHLEEPIIPYARDLGTTEVIDYEALAEWIEELSKRFYIVEGVYDSYEGIGFEQVLQKRPLSQIKMENFTSTKTSEMFQAFKMLMYNEQLELYDYMLSDLDHDIERQGYAPYIQELLELEGTRRGKKLTIVEAPQVRGKYDDFADALVRSVWLALDRLAKTKSAGGLYRPVTLGTGGPGVNDGVGAQYQYTQRSNTDYQRRRDRSRGYISKRDPRGRR